MIDRTIHQTADVVRTIGVDACDTGLMQCRIDVIQPCRNRTTTITVAPSVVTNEEIELHFRDDLTSLKQLEQT